MVEYGLTSLGTGGEPQTLKEALNCTDKVLKWRAAVQAELDQIERLGTWEIMEAPTDANVVLSKYIFKYKRDKHSHIAKYKARLVACGFTQKFGIDYFDTHVWIVRWETIRNLLAQAATHGSVIHQADINNAYLNAKIKEDIYVELPPSYTDFRPLPSHLTGKRAICKLKKGLYGTKQASHGWYMKLRDTFISLGYKVSNSDLGIFYKFSKEKYTIIAVATDDLMIIAESMQSGQLIKDQLNQHFKIVDLSEIKWLLGIHMTRDLKNRTISLGQQAYINEIIQHFGLEDAHPISMPMEPSANLMPGTPHVSPIRLTAQEQSFYHKMIGALLYLSTVTRADIAYAISMLSCYLAEPSKTHLLAISWFSEAKTLNYKHTLMPIGPLRSTTTRFLVSPSFMVKVQSLGARRSSQLLPYRVPKQNMLLSHTLSRIYFGTANSILNFHRSLLIRPPLQFCSFATIKVLSYSQRTRPFICI